MMLLTLRALKEIIQLICALVYAMFLPFIRVYPNRIIIYYHSIKKKDIRQFEKQMAYLADRCKVVKPSEVKTARIEERATLVAITFDDAFISVIENAVPVLKKHELTAAIFVPTGNLGQAPRWEIPENYTDQNEIVMSQAHIEELSNDGFEIFSHTISHPILTQIDENELRTELLASKKELERIIGYEVIGISYPHGACDAGVRDAAKQIGYKFGFTIEPRTVNCSTDNMKIGRFKVSPADSMLKFRLKVNGAYQAVRYLQKAKKLFMRKSRVPEI